jgi:hypothetical protein
MKTIIISLLLAVVLFLGASVSWRQAKRTTDLADAHLRLATLRFSDVDGLATNGANPVQPGWRFAVWQDDDRKQRTAVTYWLAHYDELTPLLNSTGNAEATDPALLFAAANAAFRTSRFDVGDRKAAVERLDGVIQAYANLLRVDPGNADAAYNYEYVAKLRDSMAKNRPRSRTPPPETDAVSADLPRGLTIHGRPGAPPVGAETVNFKTITPMRFDEREESTPGRGKPQRRRG